MYRFLLFIIGVYVTSCGNVNQDDIKQFMSQKVKLPKASIVSILGQDTIINDQLSLDFKLVIYRDSSGCTYCELKNMYEWDSFIYEAKKINSKIGVYYIFAPSSKDMYESKLGLKSCQFNHPIIIDKNNEFERLNPHLPKNKAMHTFLLDENNNVVLVGNPLHNPKIERMFKEIVEKKLGKKE